MTSSSKPGAPRQVPPPAGSKSASNYARFIPREELHGFAAWTPDAFAGLGGSTATQQQAEPPPAEPTPADHQAALLAARQAGYQDGYRDGLVALEGFKQSFAQQTTAQVGLLMTAFEGQFELFEQQMADAVARTATALARQVLRSELATRPELVAKVAEDAVNAVLLSARHIRVHLHPDDHTLIAEGAAEAIAARGARLSASSQVQRGGCLIESDVGSIDARIEARWAQAAGVLGQDMLWDDTANETSPAPGRANAGETPTGGRPAYPPDGGLS
jgi:flagellar assembly protein FliH